MDRSDTQHSRSSNSSVGIAADDRNPPSGIDQLVRYDAAGVAGADDEVGDRAHDKFLRWLVLAMLEMAFISAKHTGTAVAPLSSRQPALPTHEIDQPGDCLILWQPVKGRQPQPGSGIRIFIVLPLLSQLRGEIRP